MVVKIELQALKESSVTIEETAEFFMKIHASTESKLNIFATPHDITHSVQKICEYINNNYTACLAAVVEGLNVFIVCETFKESPKNYTLN